MTWPVDGVDGLAYNADPSSNFTSKIDVGWDIGHHPQMVGQTVNVVAGNVANQGCGTVACPALNALATGTVTISDSTITAHSLIFVVIRRGTTTPAATAYCIVQDVMTPTTGSVVVNVVNLGAVATLSTDEALWYWVVN